MASQRPVVLVGDCGCDEPSISTVLKGLLNVDDLPSPAQPCDDIAEYPWKLENKYYTADVLVHQLLPRPAVVSASVSDSPVEALLITFDPAQDSSWTSAKQWAEFAEERDLEIRLMLCDQVPSAPCGSTAVAEDQRSAAPAALDKETALQWCIKNGFELVEMRPSDEDDEDDQEDDFAKELHGVDRCVQVINAHPWTNLVLKDKDPTQRERPSPPSSPRAAGAAGAEGAEASELPSSLADLEKLHAEKASQNREKEGQSSAVASGAAEALKGMADGDAQDEGDAGAFEQLFEKFGAMKAQADNLDPNERKAYAEKVVMAFWDAMGGDTDEIGDLDDSDDEN